ncbi:MAG: hypothetical protein AAF502_09885 [Bacteroidota bacterium]
MNKKYTFFSTLSIILLLVSTAYAQSFYINLETRYRAPIIKTTLGPRITNAGQPNESISEVRGSFGKGVGLNAEFGYMFNQHFGFGLNVEYVAGIKTLAEEISSGNSLDESIAGVRRLYLTPTFTVEGGQSPLKPYAKIGVVLPTAGHVNGFRTSNDPSLLDPLIDILFPDAQSFTANSKVNGQFSVGFQGLLGVKLKVNASISAFANVGFTVSNLPRERFVVNEAILVDADGNAIDVLPLLSLGGQWMYTEYVDEINLQELQDQMAAGATAFADNPPFDLSNPTTISEQFVATFTDLQTYYGTEAFPHKELKIDSNFNSLIFGVGLSYTLGGKRQKAE